MTSKGQEPRSPTIGVLTALPMECAAVRVMLDNEHPAHCDGFYLGEVPSEAGIHRVAVGLLTDMGNNSAAITASRMLHEFPSVQDIIMCGIAGGVPRPGDVERDVRLGDIVVSDRNGVVQFDLVKERPTGSKEHRHPPRPPSARLPQPSQVSTFIVCPRLPTKTNSARDRGSARIRSRTSAPRRSLPRRMSTGSRAT